MSSVPLVPRQYAPYVSDDEASETSSVTSDTSEDSYYSDTASEETAKTKTSKNESPTSTVPNYAHFAQQLILKDTQNPYYDAIKQQNDFGLNRIAPNVPYAPYEQTTDPKPMEYGKTKFATQPQSQAAIIAINSRDRDRKAYPQPTFLTLRLPRVYKNITALTLEQFKILTSFYYFRSDKNNLAVTILEKGRTINNVVTSESNKITVQIRPGSYGIDALQTELQTQLNRTPLFYDFVNGISDFANGFFANGDFGLNFNEPGDNFYDNVSDTFIQNPTKNLIVSKFWQVRYAGRASYTFEEVLVAYYYPPLKEYAQDETYRGLTINYQAGIGVDPNVTTVNDVRERILYTFQGIDDAVILAVINGNRISLDAYRTAHTFRYSLVNRYIVNRDSFSQRVYITTTGLNTSLSNLLTTQYTKFQTQAIASNGYTNEQFVSTTVENDRLRAVLQDMYDYQQTQYRDIYAVGYNTYSLSYYANLNNTILLRNGTNAINIPANTAEAFEYASTAGFGPSSINIQDDILNVERVNPKYYWPQFSNLVGNSNVSLGSLNVSSLYTSNAFQSPYRRASEIINVNNPYIMTASNFNSNYLFIDNSGYIFTDKISGSGNVLVDIEPSRYALFRFNSPVRQTLQVETLPRPLIYRYPDYNTSSAVGSLTYNSTLKSVFDISYCYFEDADRITPTSRAELGYEYIYDNLKSTFISTVAGWDYNDDNWSTFYTQSESYWGSASRSYDINTSNQALYYTFFTPYYADSPPASDQDPVYRYRMNLNIEFSTPIVNSDSYHAFLYHDRAAFQADANLSYKFQESPYNWKYSTVLDRASNIGTITFDTYEGQQYYVYIRADSPNYGANNVRIVPYFPETFEDDIPYVYSVERNLSTIQDLVPSTDYQNSVLYNSSYSGQEFYLSTYAYASVYDPAFLKLPSQSNLWPPDPTKSQATRGVDISNVPIGYDASGVSSDYTDYIPFRIASIVAFDPSGTNIAIDPLNRYQFQSNAPYNQTQETFFYYSSGTLFNPNAVFRPGLTNIYHITSTVTEKQVKLVHYYSPQYIAEPAINAAIDNIVVREHISTTSTQMAYTSSVTNGFIKGYEYDSSGILQLGGGPIGFSMIPPEGIWDVERLMFRSAICDSNYDLNRQYISYMGLYSAYDIVDSNYTDIQKQNAITVMKLSSAVTYQPSNQDGFDKNGGTYYHFVKDTTFVPQYSNFIGGYTQPQGSMVNRTLDMYMWVAFDSNDVPFSIKGLSGSTIPYPFYNDISNGDTYLDGTYPPNNFYGVVYPSTNSIQHIYNSSLITPENYAPPPGNDGTQSQYILSQPIGTSVIPYAVPFNLYASSNVYWPWDFQENIPTYIPDFINANVYEHIMLRDGDYHIYDIGNAETNRAFGTGNTRWTITADEVFDKMEKTSLVAVTGNTSNYVFLGFKDISSSTVVEGVIKFFNPNNGIFSTWANASPYYFNKDLLVNKFTYNNMNDFVVSGSVYNASANRKEGYLYWSYDKGSTITTYQFAGTPSNLTHGQDPDNPDIYVLPLDASGYSQKYYKPTITNSNPTFPGTLYHMSSMGGFEPLGYSDIILNKNAAFDEILLTTIDPRVRNSLDITNNTNYNSYMYRTSNVFTQGTSTIALVNKLGRNFMNDDEDQGVILQAVNGYNNSRWLITEKGAPYVWGNRNNTYDLTFQVNAAWQIFYPFQKVVLKQVNNAYNPITDLNYIDYPEYPHTSLFYYENYNSMCNDIFYKWGVESKSNFKVANVNAGGFYFNSYLFNVPVQQTSGSNYQYLAIRNYSPTERSQVMVRFFLPNLYDHGYVTFNDLIDEISTAKSGTEDNLFNPTYRESLLQFDNQFDASVATDISGRFWGADLIPGFKGSNLDPFYDYRQFASTYSAYYTRYSTTAAVIQNVYDSANNGVNQFIATQLSNILPSNALLRQRFTDPLTFSILWKSSLTPQYVNLNEEWGLGWNLGYAKADTPYSTVARADSFYKIYEDYIYLRLNQELDMNRVDSGASENLQLTRDATGQVKNYYAKILLSGFNSYSQTYVTNPIRFNPPLPKLEVIQVQLINNVGVQIDNADCDWHCTVNVTEQNNVATVDSGIPKL